MTTPLTKHQPLVLNPKLLLEVAKHEAGHAVVGAALGGHVKHIDMDNGTGAHVDIIVKKRSLRWYDNVVLSLAGLAGERINDEEPGHIVFSNSMDRRIRKDINESLDVLPSRIWLGDEMSPTSGVKGASFRIIDECLAVAWNILRENRDVHAELCRRLVATHRSGGLRVCSGSDISDFDNTSQTVSQSPGVPHWRPE